eukprot:m.10547 g.10547  ORF g.10547 m.10547 type:complete len:519 (+) comp6638_c0_seq2:74-1630(+)
MSERKPQREELTKVRVTKIVTKRNKEGGTYSIGFGRSPIGDVFIPSMHLEQNTFIREGVVFETIVRKDPQKDPRKKNDWKVRHVIHTPNKGVEWKSYQLETHLPNTAPRKEIQMEFACFKCGQKVLDSDSIFKIKDSSVWTNCLKNNFAIRKAGNRMYNEYKKGFLFQAECSKCGFNLGTYYETKFETDKDNREFPCAKLTFRRSLGRNANASVNQMAIISPKSEELVESYCNKLESSAQIEALPFRMNAEFRGVFKKRIKEEGDQVPSHWEGEEMKRDVTNDMWMKVEHFLNESAEPQQHGIGRDSNGLKFSKFKVKKVWQIQNKDLWKSFKLSREKMDGRLKKHHITPKLENGEPSTVNFASNPDDSPMFLFQDVASRESVGEHIFFHGCTGGEDVVEKIIREGFDDRVGSLHGLFGSGCYFAESSSKAAEYLPKDDDVVYIFISRVLLGDALETNEMFKKARRAPHNPTTDCMFDSLVANTKKHDKDAFLKRFREFIVYERNQIYPELVVAVKRV